MNSPQTAALQSAPYRPTDDPIEVIYSDADLAVIIKPANLLTVPGRGPDKVDCAERRLRALGHDFVRAAHRLDQDTSGLLIMGLSPAGHRAANMMFEARALEKRYEAVCWVKKAISGKHWEIDLPLKLDWPNRPRHKVDFESGKPSRTAVELIDLAMGDEGSESTARLRLTPLTGRSHQLRVHLSHTGLPICGDPLYGQDALGRLHLHATQLSFVHPLTGKPLTFQAPAPF